MNFYPMYPGDYGRDTAHLSLMEHGIYFILMNTYYSTEKPLPSGWESLFRITRATHEADQEAVRSVIGQFFFLEDGFYRNQKCDRIIHEARIRIENARKNGTMGGRPPNPPKDKKITQRKPSGLATDNPAETQRQSSPSPSPSPSPEPTPEVKESGEGAMGKENDSPRKPSSPKPSEEAKKLNEELIAIILKDDPLFKVDGHEKWLVEADRLLRLDHRHLSEALEVLRWAKSDKFWTSNILSMPKFREKYPQLRAKWMDSKQSNGSKFIPRDGSTTR